tara:strand:+ start:54 stop:497 length:444 start_codon:yes stop_codon:yes gene_type:complete
MEISYKIPKNKWLNTRIKYSDDTINDCLNYIFKLIISWINNKDKIIYTGEFTIDYNNFTEFIYNQYIPPIKKIEQNENELFEYFDLNYSDSIHDLYSDITEYTISKNLHLFQNNTYDYLIDYIYSIIIIEDPYIDDKVNDDFVDEYE